MVNCLKILGVSETAEREKNSKATDEQLIDEIHRRLIRKVKE